MIRTRLKMVLTQSEMNRIKISETRYLRVVSLLTYTA